MNIRLRGRLWVVRWDIDSPWWGMYVGAMPNGDVVLTAHYVGPLVVTRIYRAGEYTIPTRAGTP